MKREAESIFLQNTKLNKYKRSRQTCHILHHVPYLNQILSLLQRKVSKTFLRVVYNLSYIYFFESLPFPLLTVRHIFEISADDHPSSIVGHPRPRYLMNFRLRYNSWEICLSMRELKVRGARENCVWHAGNLKTKINHS